MSKESILHYIKEYAQSQPDVPAVCELRKSLTYALYWTNIKKMASVLHQKGVQAQDHVILRCTQNIEYLTIFSALQYLRAVVIPVEKSTAPDRMTEIGKKVDAGWLISDTEAEGMNFLSEKGIVKEMPDAEMLEQELPGAEDRSMILFTTGTTGASKGVVMHHRNDVAIAGNVITGTGMKKNNAEIIPMPLNHSFGIRRYQSDMVNGGTVCLMDGMAFVGVLWKLLDKYHVSSLAIAPATLGILFQLSGDRIGDYKDQIDFIQIGSAPLSEADKERLLTLLPKTRLYNFYGSSEAGCSCILEFSGKDNKVGCIGRPTINSRVRFTDEEGNILPNGSAEEPAYLSWGGDIVMEGYYKDPDLTENTILDGYVKTNDLGYLDEEGRCILVGRADDVINYGGTKISPAEIENCALNYAGIQDCAYTSVPDPITGELPVMLVVPGEEYEEAALSAFLAAHLEGYKLPQAYYETEQIPKTFKGSVLRKEVKKTAEILRKMS